MSSNWKWKRLIQTSMNVCACAYTIETWLVISRRYINSVATTHTQRTNRIPFWSNASTSTFYLSFVFEFTCQILLRSKHISHLQQVNCRAVASSAVADKRIIKKKKKKRSELFISSVHCEFCLVPAADPSMDDMHGRQCDAPTRITIRHRLCRWWRLKSVE